MRISNTTTIIKILYIIEDEIDTKQNYTNYIFILVYG